MAESLTSPQAFGGVFDRYFATIHGYLARRVGRSRADDLTGEVFRVAFTARGNYDARTGGVRPWLYGIANNVIRQYRRDGERAERAWTRLDPDPGIVEDTELAERIDAQVLVTRLDQALDRILPADREALMLYAVEQLTYAEVADLTGTPVGTVRSRIARARNQLRSAVEVLRSSTTEPQGAQHG